MKNRVLYFAYGQMMNPDCMKQVCSRAKPMCAATLKQYRLAERRYADIDPDPASEIYGVLYAITPGDRKKLDRHAGSMNYAGLEVEVEFGDVTYKALTYMMTPEGKRKNDGIPYGDEYLRLCRSGAMFYLVPNAFRYANVIVYGIRMTGEKDESFTDHAITVRPCTIAGTLYDTGFGYPVFSQEGNTVIEAEYMRIPRDLLEFTLENLTSKPVKPVFMVAKAADGSTFGGWTVCLDDEAPSRARIIESGCWRDRRKLKYDAIEFGLISDECNAELKIDFSDGTISAELHKMPPNGEEVKRKGSCRFSKYWRKEILSALRECRFERWQTRYRSNGERSPLWFLELKNGENTVKFIRGMNVFPLNWDMFQNVFGLCLRLCCGEEAASASAKNKAEKNAPEPKSAENKAGIPAAQDDVQAMAGDPAASAKPTPAPENKPRKLESTPAKRKKAKSDDPELEPELPLFDGDVPYSASGLFKGEKKDDAAAAGPESDKPAEQDPGAKQDGHDDLCPDPPPPDTTDRG